MFRAGARFTRTPCVAPSSAARFPVHGWEKASDPTHKRLRRLLISCSRRPIILSLTVALSVFCAALWLLTRPPLVAVATHTARAMHAAPLPVPVAGGSAGGGARGGDPGGRLSASKLLARDAAVGSVVVRPERPDRARTARAGLQRAGLQRAGLQRAGLQRAGLQRTAAEGDGAAEREATFDVRVVVVVPGPEAVSVERFSALVASLAKATYTRPKGVALDVFLIDRREGFSLARVMGEAASTAKFDALQSAGARLHWPHGPKQIIVKRDNDEWINLISGTPSILVFADIASSFSPAYFDSYVSEALDIVVGSDKHSPVAGAPILATALDAVIPAGLAGDTQDSHGSGTVARTGVFFPACSAFAPTPEAWTLFKRWRQVQATRDQYETVAAIGGFPVSLSSSKATLHFPDLDKSVLSKDDVRISFAEFVYWYGGHILHPVVRDGLLLVDRDPVAATSAGEASPLGGASAPKTQAIQYPLRLRSRAEGCCSLHGTASRWPVSVPRNPTFLALAGNSSLAEMRSVPFSSSTGLFRGFDAASVKPAELDATNPANFAHANAVARIANYAKERGGGQIAFTLVTEAFVETTYSWVCNSLAVGSLPKALVFGASDAKVVLSLETLFSNDARLSPQDALVVDLGDAIRATSTSAKPEKGLDFGQSSYWLLMLERTALLRDVLDAGVAVLHFETDQIWFRDPMIDIERCMRMPAGVERGGGMPGEILQDRTPVDMVITINTREEASGNFFYLRPTLATRHLWSLVTSSFQASYRKSRSSREAKEGKWHYIENDQSLFTKFGLGKDPWYHQNFPAATYTVLDRERFLDGTWYLDFEGENGSKVATRSHYTSKESLDPVVLNNNFMIGVGPKKLRAQRFGHWFWDETRRSCNSTIGTGVGQSPLMAVPSL